MQISPGADDVAGGGDEGCICVAARKMMRHWQAALVAGQQRQAPLFGGREGLLACNCMHASKPVYWRVGGVSDSGKCAQ